MQIHPTPRRSPRSGGVLLAALIAVSIIAVLGAGLVRISSAQLRRHGQAIDSKRALYAAEAGLSEAWFAVAQGKSGNVGSPEQPAAFSTGVYWVEATWLPDDQIALRSTGLVGSGRFAIDVVLRRPVSPFADLGVFGDASVLIEPESIVDGWDSARGEWKPWDERGELEDFPVHVRSNGDVEARGESTDPARQTQILGDFQPGPGGEVTLEDGVLLTGTNAPGPSLIELPPVEVPEAARDQDRVVQTNETLQGARLGFKSLTVRSGVTLTLTGPLELVVGGLRVEGDGILRVDGDAGPVSIYVDGPVHAPAGTGLETAAGGAADAALFLLERRGDDPGLALSEPLDFAPAGDFQGLIYAPDAYLVLPASLRLMGAVGAGRLEVAPGSRITFDLEARHSPIGAPSLPLFLSWRVVELPDEPLVRRRIDPLDQLALQGIAPLPSAQAHLEQEIDLVYLDSLGFLASYRGDVGDLDWSQVCAVLSQNWPESPVDPEGLPPQEPGGEPDPGSSSEAKDKLLAASPLSDLELYDAIVAAPPLDGSDLKDVLLFNSPLTEKLLIIAMTEEYGSPLSSSEIKDVLIASAPLSSEVLNELTAVSSKRVSLSDKDAVLVEQGKALIKK